MIPLKIQPKAAVVFTGIEGFDLGQDQLDSYKIEFIENIGHFCQTKIVDFTVNNENKSKEANQILLREDMDVLILVIVIWTPDSIVLDMVNGLNVPVIVFTTSLSTQTIGINGAQIVACSFKESHIKYKFIFGNIKKRSVQQKIENYALAAAIFKRLQIIKIGWIGHIPDIMLSLSVDLFSVKNIMGPSVMPIDFYTLERYIQEVKKEAIGERVAEISKKVQKITVEHSALRESVQYYLGLKRLVKDFALNIIALNCYPFPALKGKTCLAVSNLNDDGIVVSCEGDIHAAILMAVLQAIDGRACLDSDVIIEDMEKNAIVFSHCGGGPFSCAADIRDVELREHYEVKSGLGVYYPVKIDGEPVTIMNLTGRETTYRMCLIKGHTIATDDLTYYGNPLTVRFKNNVEDIINQIGNEGFGHHWVVSYGDHGPIIQELSDLLGIRLTYIE